MKIFILTISILIVSSLKLFPQWSTDPNNNLIVDYGQDPKICSDSTGGCYITYDYHSTSYPRWLALERLDKYGYKPWGINKRILGELPEQWQAEIIEDGEGGVIVSYEDNEWIPPYDFTTRVRVQKVDSNGSFLWGQTGVRVSVEEINHGGQDIVSDGYGGAVVLWVNNDAEYKVNRISSTGERIWGDSGIVLGINGYGDPSLLVRTTGNKYVASPERNMYKYFDENGNVFYTGSVVWLENIISDGYGGIIITSRGGQWPDNWQLRAQRKDSLGNSLWEEPHIVVAESLYINTRNKIRNNDGLYFFSWSGKRNGIDIIAQFQALRLDGSKLFPDGGISISNYLPLSIAGIIPSELSKTIIIWNNDPNLPDSSLAQVYDTLGNKIWNENGIVIAHPAISYQGYTIDRNGGFIIGGIINEFTVVAQQVSKYGNLGEIITSMTREDQEIFPTELTLYQNYPNPFNSSTVISYSIPREGKVTLELYNAIGELIITIINGHFDEGMHIVSLSSDNLPSGVYLYKLQTDTQVLIKKLLIIK
jgi:hypothetical protein